MIVTSKKYQSKSFTPHNTEHGNFISPVSLFLGINAQKTIPAHQTNIKNTVGEHGTV